MLDTVMDCLSSHWQISNQPVAGCVMVTALQIKAFLPFLLILCGPMRSTHILSHGWDSASFSGKWPHFCFFSCSFCKKDKCPHVKLFGPSCLATKDVEQKFLQFCSFLDDPENCDTNQQFFVVELWQWLFCFFYKLVQSFFQHCGIFGTQNVLGVL